jgi:hypothetical protein
VSVDILTPIKAGSIGQDRITYACYTLMNIFVCRNRSEIYEVALFLTCAYVVKPDKYNGKIMYHIIITEKCSFLSHNVFTCFALFSEYRINTSLTSVNRVFFVMEMQ